ncbi:MAG: hypothetical protein B7Y43_19850 [Sphingomonas sp. 28-62-20]|uniref:HNH endonuclease n=1 Tax=Sphingomonas sp. 28-62-20 TaxID=1970433 RepID=UPI000BDC9559|nr:MAG: hypothetical protein B7Y43_19850 [Sphingomonas sp. 28-62-20]
MSKLISLTRGQFATVDDADFDELAGVKWYAQSRGNGTFYAARRGRHKGPLIYMHRVVNQTPDALHTDHINGDPLDNRRSNLRSVTAAQNAMNKPAQKGRTAKGAWFDGSTSNANKWRAAIRLNGKLKYLGRFPTEELASAAYATAAKLHFGQFNRSES